MPALSTRQALPGLEAPGPGWPARPGGPPHPRRHRRPRPPTPGRASAYLSPRGQPDPHDRMLGGRLRGLRLLHRLDPLGPPGWRFPRLPEIDPLADDLAVAELHDAHDVVGRLAVVGDGVLVDPQVLPANGPMHLEAESGGIGGAEGEDVRLAPDAFPALGELQHGV